MRWSARTPIGPALASLLLVAACSSGPPVWSRDEAARHYVAMSAPVSGDLSVLASLSPDASVEDWVRVCRRLVTSNGGFIAALRAGRWDPSVRPFVDDVVTGATGTQTWYEDCAGLTSIGQLDTLGKISARNTKPNATSNLREQLRLPLG